MKRIIEVDYTIIVQLPIRGDTLVNSYALYMHRRADASRIMKLLWDVGSVKAVALFKGTGEAPIETLGPFDEEQA